MRAFLFMLLAITLSAKGDEPPPSSPACRYLGMCDASAAVAVSSNLFIAADDENNILRLYQRHPAGAALKQFDLNDFLEVRGRSREADLEGAARIGNRAFWIGSHGRNRNGKERDNRCRFFATDLAVTNGDVLLTPVGKPCRRLVEDMVRDPRLERFGLAAAAERAPKQRGGLNIEGLSATPEGALLIGFRNPIPAGKALLIPLLNPNEVIGGKPAQFGPAIELDLGGLGIRDMALCGQTYIIIAGPSDESGAFRFYRWQGIGSVPEPLKTPSLSGYNPEAVVVYPQSDLSEFQVLSDDGVRLVEGCPCKLLTDPNQKSFRGLSIRIP